MCGRFTNEFTWAELHYLYSPASVDLTIERASAGYILHALTDFLAADLDELRQKGN